MASQSHPPGTFAACSEEENAAHILIQAMHGMSAHLTCSGPSDSQPALHHQAAGIEHEKSEKSCSRLPLLPLDRNTRVRLPSKYAAFPKALPKHKGSGAITFKDQDSFEEWAIERLTASHAQVVIEKKRR